MTEKKRDTLFFMVFGLVWLCLIVWNLLVPKQTFSQAENRNLAKFPTFTVPTLLDGAFMDDVNTYLNDHFAGRPYWVSGQTLMEYGLGKREVNRVFLGTRALQGNLPPEDAAMSPENIRGVNAFAERYGLPTYAMLVPSSASVQAQNLPPFADPWDEKAYIDAVNAAFSEAVTPVPLFDALSSHRDEYIYYRTDHHWTSYGAYLANCELQKAMGRPVPAPEDFAPRTVSEDFRGTYHSKTGFPLVQPDTIELYQQGSAVEMEIFDGAGTTRRSPVYYEEFLSRKDQYSYFLGQVQPMVTLHTGAPGGKKLLVFKDSYAHCLVPMLFGQYSEIRLVDLRFLNAADYGEALDVARYDEALFLYSADVFAHQKGPYKLQ